MGDQVRSFSRELGERRNQFKTRNLRRVLFVGVGGECSKMNQRDWELLEQQMRGFNPPPNDRIMELTVAAVFVAGLVLGGFLFGPESGSVQPAGHSTKVAIYLPNGSR
jgi:hypothetical protein